MPAIAAPAKKSNMPREESVEAPRQPLLRQDDAPQNDKPANRSGGGPGKAKAAQVPPGTVEHAKGCAGLAAVAASSPPGWMCPSGGAVTGRIPSGFRCPSTGPPDGGQGPRPRGTRAKRFPGQPRSGAGRSRKSRQLEREGAPQKAVCPSASEGPQGHGNPSSRGFRRASSPSSERRWPITAICKWRVRTALGGLRARGR